MHDPVILNDLAGQAILEGRHEEASRLLTAAAYCPGVSVEAKRVLHDRAQEQARKAWFQRYPSLAESR